MWQIQRLESERPLSVFNRASIQPSFYESIGSNFKLLQQLLTVTADCCCVCFLKTREALGWVKTTSFWCDNLLEIPASLANLGHAPHWWLWVIVVLIRQDIGISSIGLAGERRLHFRKASVLRLFYLRRHADFGGVWHISDMYAYFPRRLQLVSISFTPLETLLQLTVVFSSLHPMLVAVFRSTVC